MKHPRRKFLQLALSSEVAAAFSEFRPGRLLAADDKFVQQGEIKPNPPRRRNLASPESGSRPLSLTPASLRCPRNQLRSYPNSTEHRVVARLRSTTGILPSMGSPSFP